MNEYGKKCRLENEVIVHLAGDQLQIIVRDTCGMYQIFFYIKLLTPLENISIFESLNKQTVEKLLNKILLTDRHENETKIEQFTGENDIQRG